MPRPVGMATGTGANCFNEDAAASEHCDGCVVHSVRSEQPSQLSAASSTRQQAGSGDVRSIRTFLERRDKARLGYREVK